MSNPNHTESVARRKCAANIPTWQMSGFKCVGDDAAIIYGGATTTFIRGPRKGQTKWIEPRTECVVTRAEERAEYARYERETGRCGDCDNGQKVVGWSSTTGPRFVTCLRCNGSNIAPPAPRA